MGENAARSQVIECLNRAQLQSDASQKVLLLTQVEEILVHRYPETMLPEFLQHVLGFQIDPTPSVKKFVADFVEKACKKNPSYFKECAGVLLNISNDNTPSVLKKVIAAFTILLPQILNMLANNAGINPNDISNMWGTLRQLQKRAIACLDHDNDGVRLQVLKFIETLALCFSYPPPDIPVVATRHGVKPLLKTSDLQDEFNLSLLPPTHPLLNARQLSEEGAQYVRLLIDRLHTESSRLTNISVTIQSLFNIAKKRKAFWPDVIPALCDYHTKIPPDFSESQTASIRHTLKASLLALLKMPSTNTNNYRELLLTALDDLGAKDQAEQALRFVDREANSRAAKEIQQPYKRPGEAQKDYRDTKKARMAGEPDYTNLAPVQSTHPQPVQPTQPAPLPMGMSFPTPPQPVTEYITLYDTPLGRPMSVNEITDTVVDALLQAQLNVPPPPPHLIGNFTARTFIDILSMSLLTGFPGDASIIQGLLNGVLPAGTRIQQVPRPVPQPAIRVDPRRDPRLRGLVEAQPAAPPMQYQPQPIQQQPIQQAPESAMALPKPEPQVPPTIKQEAPPQVVEEPRVVAPPQPPLPEFVLKSRPLSQRMKEELCNAGFERILKAETAVEREGKGPLRVAMLSRMVSNKEEGGNWYTRLFEYIQENFRNRFELALQWLYQEYATFCLENAKKEEDHNGVKEEEELPESATRYDRLFNAFVDTIKDNQALDAVLLPQLLTEAPKITGYVFTVLREYLEAPPQTAAAANKAAGPPPLNPKLDLGLNILLDLIQTRIPLRQRFLMLLLEYAIHRDTTIRTQAIRYVTFKLFNDARFTQNIEEFAFSNLKKLTAPPGAPTTPSSAPTTPAQQSRSESDGGGETTMEEAPSAEDDSRMLDVDSAGATTTAPAAQTSTAPSEAGQQQQPSEGASSSGWTEDEVRRHILLFFALCAARPELLNRLVEVYTQISPKDSRVEPRKTFHTEIKPLIQELGKRQLQLPPHLQAQSPLFQFLSKLPKGSETLALQFVQVLAENPQFVTPKFVSIVVNDIYFGRIPEPRFIIPIITHLTREEAQSALRRIVMLPTPLVKTALEKILNAAAKNQPTPFTPSQLLFELHQLDGGDPKVLKQAMAAQQVCFGFKSLYRQDVLAEVIQRLVDQTPVPSLLMRTLIQSVKMYPALKKFATGILSRLIPKRVWENPILYEGWVHCVKMTDPESYAAVLQLPKAEFERFLRANPGFKEPLTEYVKQATASRAAVTTMTGAVSSGKQAAAAPKKAAGVVAAGAKFNPGVLEVLGLSSASLLASAQEQQQQQQQQQQQEQAEQERRQQRQQQQQQQQQQQEGNGGAGEAQQEGRGELIGAGDMMSFDDGGEIDLTK